MTFSHCSELPYFPKILSRSATREVTHIYQFITNNKTSFHLCGTKNLVKHQKFSKYYDHVCRLIGYIFVYESESVCICYGKCEKLGNMHIFQLLCIILKIGLFIRDFE